VTPNKNDRWIQKNFGALIDLYGGRCVAVDEGRVVAVGDRPETAERRARAAGSKGPSLVRVPSVGRTGGTIDPFRLFRFS
jgi:hypothetical protein